MLHIGPGLRLPPEAVTETFAIVAKRGVGKTYTAAVMVEEMVKAALPVVVVDPIGVWWGLRSGRTRFIPTSTQDDATDAAHWAGAATPAGGSH